MRKAIATAIDKNFITKALMGGYGDRPTRRADRHAEQPVRRHRPGALSAPTWKAGEMLDAAGYKATRTASASRSRSTTTPVPTTSKSMSPEYPRAALKKVGIAVDVRASADFPAWAKRMATHDFDLGMDLVFNWGDPIIGVHRTYLSTNIKPIVWTNTQSYSNPKVDELLNTAGGILDPTKRKAYYATFEKIVTDELPEYIVNQVPYYTATTKRVGNVPASIWGMLSPMDDAPPQSSGGP